MRTEIAPHLLQEPDVKDAEAALRLRALRLL